MAPGVVKINQLQVIRERQIPKGHLTIVVRNEDQTIFNVYTVTTSCSVDFSSRVFSSRDVVCVFFLTVTLTLSGD
jgi:hypothetical protein